MMPMPQNVDEQVTPLEPELSFHSVELALLHKSSLDIVCDKIRENNNELEEEQISVLYSLFDETLFKALELLDKDSVVLITITNKERKYLLVEDQGHYYTVYLHIPFCKCDQFRDFVTNNKYNNICYHILACELALALGSYDCASTENFGVQPFDDLVDQV